MGKLVALLVAVVSALSTLALPAHATNTSPLTTTPVFVVGDSLTVGALAHGLAARMAVRGYSLKPPASAAEGRSVDEGLSVLAGRSVKPQRVLLSLGSNDCLASASMARSWVTRARAAAGPSATIFWVNIRVLDSTCRHSFDAVNAGLLAGVRADRARQLSLGRSATSWLLDWNQFAINRHIATRSDGTHYTDYGYRMRSIFYAEAMASRGSWARYRRA